MDSYKKIMDQINADDEFRENLKKKLSIEQQKRSKRKGVATPSRLYPFAAAVASAAVLVLVFSFSRAYILPLLRYDSYDGAGADKYSQVQLSPRDDKTEGEAVTENDEVVTVPDKPAPDKKEDAYTKPSKKDDKPETKKPKPEALPEESEERNADNEFVEPPQSAMSYKIVSFAGFGETAQPQTANTVNYDTLLHFTFVGFEQYDIGLYRNDMLFVASLPDNYTLADFFTEYYDAIVATEGMTDIQHGIVESFFGVSADSEAQINVYAEGIEVLNLETTPMSRFKDMSHVYLTVSVV